MPNRPVETVAAVDLGSNSFHMVVAKDAHGHLHLLDRLRERVALAEGLTKDGRLDDAVAQRALDCLRRFGQRLRFMPGKAVRAVGTSTLRKLDDGEEFLRQAAKALGHPIEIVAGSEEARLVYLGVAHHAPYTAGRRLVVDIGGGSTEIIVGEGFEARETASLDMGCVSWSRRFFPDGKFGDESFERAEIAAALELRAVKRKLKSLGWEQALGSSGTIRAIASILAERRTGSGIITPEGLDWLRTQIVAAKTVKKLDLPGMGQDRQSVLAGGVAVLRAVFRTLGIEAMEAASGALREGVLYDLLGRIHHEDVRDRTIRAMSQRHRIDDDQASRVERCALDLFDQAEPHWGLADEDRRTLAWAARLHEIGLSVSYSGYQRHGAYLVANGDMPGFSEVDKRQLAALIATHRSKPAAELFSAVAPAAQETTRKLCALLRIAVRLNRSRSLRALPKIRLAVARAGLVLEFPEGWLDDHLLTRTDLLEEAQRLELLGFGLDVR
jgi:exopolyphosphatase/guanosine-5'-triphosphate,3'-diphosphate pyrophosphatase